MNSKDSYLELGDAQKRLEPLDQDQLYQALQHSVEAHPWRSLLIYGLYARQTGSDDVSAFFARKTLEAIEEVCERGTVEGRGTLLENQIVGRVYKLRGKLRLKPVLATIRRFFKRRTAKRMPESEELRLTRKRLDELLVAMTFLVFAFDSTALRAVVVVVEQGIARKIRRVKERFVDKVPLNDYLDVLEQQFREKEEAIQPLGTFFDNLIRTAGLETAPSFEQRAAKLKECVELLIEEVGRKIEKPDRIFSCADSLEPISRYAESLVDVGGEGMERFFNKYKWAYPRGRSFENLNAFWTACMIGLFAFGQALDKAIALAQVSEQTEVKAASTEAEGGDSSVTKVEKGSQKRGTQKESISGDVGYNLTLKPVASGESI